MCASAFIVPESLEEAATDVNMLYELLDLSAIPINPAGLTAWLLVEKREVRLRADMTEICRVRTLERDERVRLKIDMAKRLGRTSIGCQTFL
jgi:hypothetical protein